MQEKYKEYFAAKAAEEAALQQRMKHLVAKPAAAPTPKPAAAPTPKPIVAIAAPTPKPAPAVAALKPIMTAPKTVAMTPVQSLGRHMVKDEYLYSQTEEDVVIICYDPVPYKINYGVIVPGSWTVADFKENLPKHPFKIKNVIVYREEHNRGETLLDDVTMDDVVEYVKRTNYEIHFLLEIF